MLEAKDNKAELYSRRNCLQLSGVPETKDESVDEKMLELATAINADFTFTEIDIAHRLRKQRGEASKIKPRDIIFKFINYSARQKLHRNQGKQRKWIYTCTFK